MMFVAEKKAKNQVPEIEQLIEYNQNNLATLINRVSSMVTDDGPYRRVHKRVGVRAWAGAGAMVDRPLVGFGRSGCQWTVVFYI